MENKYPVNWEKVGVYIAIAACFLTVIIYIADIKERIAKLEVKVEKLEEK
jgi:cell division protein FtsL